MKKEDADQLIRCVRACWWRVAIVVAIPAFASVAVFSSWPWGLETPWAMLSAIGTLSATFSAVILAYIGDRRAKTLRDGIASLHAPGAVILIEEIINKMTKSVGALTYAMYPMAGNEKASNEKINELINNVNVTLSDIAQNFSAGQFAPLAGLDNVAAHRAAYGLAGLKRISFYLERALGRKTIHKNGLLLNNPQLLIKDVEEVLKYLGAAMNVLDSLSSACAPKPTDDEVFSTRY